MVSAVPIGLHCWPQDNSEDVFERNIVVVSGATEGSGKKSDSMIGPAVMPDDYGIWGTFDNNVWWNTNAKDFSTGRSATSLAQWQEKQGKHDVFADPLFVDPADGDYRVSENSPALKLGFKNFPMDQFGHQMTRVMGGNAEFEGTINVVIRPDARGGDVRYTLDGSAPTADSLLYSQPLTIEKTTTIRASTFDAQGREVGFADTATVTRVDKVSRQSWLASLLAGEYVGPEYRHPIRPGIQVKRFGTAGNASTTRGQRTRSFASSFQAKDARYRWPKSRCLKTGRMSRSNKRHRKSIRAPVPIRCGPLMGIRTEDYQNGSVTHTEQDISNPWWEVDLGRAVEIEKIVVSNRRTHQTRLDGFTLKILDRNRDVVFSKENCKQAAKIVFARKGAEGAKSINWAGLRLVTISDFPDYIDASGGQFLGVFVVTTRRRVESSESRLHEWRHHYSGRLGRGAQPGRFHPCAEFGDRPGDLQGLPRL